MESTIERDVNARPKNKETDKKPFKFGKICILTEHCSFLWKKY